MVLGLLSGAMELAGTLLPLQWGDAEYIPIQNVRKLLQACALSRACKIYANFFIEASECMRSDTLPAMVIAGSNPISKTPKCGFGILLPTLRRNSAFQGNSLLWIAAKYS